MKKKEAAPKKNGFSPYIRRASANFNFVIYLQKNYMTSIKLCLCDWHLNPLTMFKESTHNGNFIHLHKDHLHETT